MPGVFPLPRVEVFPTAPNFETKASVPKQIKTAAFGTAGANISTTQGRLYKAMVINTSATAYFIQIHNKATAPIATDVPVWERRLPVSGEVEIDFAEWGFGCALGIGIALSTTVGVLTLAAGNDAIAYASFTSV